MGEEAKYIVALDQGTTSSRTIVYDSQGSEVSRATAPLAISCPQDGWVEQDANEIWSSQFKSFKIACEKIDLNNILALGITNQRETVVCWNPKSGEILAPAIVWQCRRSASICAGLKESGFEKIIAEKTGLVVDAYFSGSKIAWLLENISGLREKVEAGNAVFGTVDSWLIYNLSGRAANSLYTEPSNASRTMLYNILTHDWDPQLLEMLNVPIECLPAVVKSSGTFPEAEIEGVRIPITGVLGDQQASLYGLGCVEVGSAKCTFGTGAFMLINSGESPEYSSSGLVSTVAWKVNSETCSYAIEGSVFMAGALVQWLRDELGFFESSEDSEELASKVDDSGGVIIVPAFTGLGAPHWDDSARGMIIGLTRKTSSSHLARAVLEAVAHQVADLIDCLPAESVKQLRIDGGMSANTLFAQILSNLCNIEVLVSDNLESTAFGAAKLAAESVGICGENGNFNSSSENANFLKPQLSNGELSRQRQLWSSAVERSKGWAV